MICFFSFKFMITSSEDFSIATPSHFPFGENAVCLGPALGSTFHEQAIFNFPFFSVSRIFNLLVPISQTAISESSGEKKAECKWEVFLLFSPGINPVKSQDSLSSPILPSWQSIYSKRMPLSNNVINNLVPA